MRRTKEMIISQILDVCTDGGAHKTKIVYQANLNFGTVKPHLELLTNNGMINTRTENDLKVFEITTRGLASIFRVSRSIGVLLLPSLSSSPSLPGVAQDTSGYIS
jgi:predicted transcriptional regulator